MPPLVPAKPKKPTTPTTPPTTGAPTGSSTGAPTGQATGQATGDELDLDECEGSIARERAGLADEVLIYEADNEGRSVGGARLGPLPLDPLGTLADRIVDEWGGPRTYWVRFRRPDGTVARWARVRQRGYRPGRARMAQQAPIAAQAVQTPAPAVPAQQGPSEAFGMLRELRDLGLFNGGAPVASAPPPPPPTIAQQVKDLTGAVTALEGAGLATRKQPGTENTVVEVVRELKPVVMDLLGQLVAGIDMLTSSRKHVATQQAAEARARADEAQAKAKATEVPNV